MPKSSAARWASSGFRGRRGRHLVGEHAGEHAGGALLREGCRDRWRGRGRSWCRGRSCCTRARVSRRPRALRGSSSETQAPVGSSVRQLRPRDKRAIEAVGREDSQCKTPAELHRYGWTLWDGFQTPVRTSCKSLTREFAVWRVEETSRSSAPGRSQPQNRQTRSASDPLTSTAIAAYADRQLGSPLAARFNIHRTTVLAHLERNGVPRRRSGSEAQRRRCPRSGRPLS